MALLSTILIFVAVLAVLVLIHEFGHFFTAKLFGIKVHEFGLGYPPRLWGFRPRGSETLYTINALPLGGFVKLAGEDKEDLTTDPSRNFINRPPWQRFIVLVSGAGMNAILPFILFAIVAMAPQDISTGDVVILGVAEDSPAAAAGIQRGDVVVKANDRDVHNHSDLSYNIQTRLGGELDLVLRRAGQPVTVTVVPRWRPPEGQGAVGLQSSTGILKVQGVAPGSIAATLGLKAGDTLLSVAGVALLDQSYVEPVLKAIGDRGDKTAAVVAWRNGTITEITAAVPADPQATLQGATFVNTPPTHQQLSPWRAVPAGAQRVLDVLVITKNETYKWLIGQSKPSVAGPVGIAQLTGEVAQAGFFPLLEFVALLSVNLAIMNILPIPALDGGRVVFVVFEWITRGKRLPPEKEAMVHLVGFVLLMSMAVLVTYLDITRIVRGESMIP